MSALIHTIGGPLTLVRPLLDSSIIDQPLTEWMGCWHMITVLLFVGSIPILRLGFGKENEERVLLVRWIRKAYQLVGIPFILSSLHCGLLAPQWILLMPIGMLVQIELEKNVNQIST